MKDFMVSVNWAGSVFVKERNFFIKQGGEKEKWGRSWQLVQANSIEDAREKGCKILPGARPYDQQAKP